MLFNFGKKIIKQNQRSCDLVIFLSGVHPPLTANLEYHLVILLGVDVIALLSENILLQEKLC